MKFLFAILFFVASSAFAYDQQPPLLNSACFPQAPFGFPVLINDNSVTICRHAYVLQYDKVAKIPAWVSYTLTPQHATGCLARSNAFAPDESLKVGERSELVDYMHTGGYDTGHIADDADMDWDTTVEVESFILTNMCPQLAGFNRGIWKKLEVAVRAWAVERNHALVVYAGPIYKYGTDTTIGPNKVDVPSGFYKIVIDSETHETLAFLFPHKRIVKAKIEDFESTVSDIEKATGITFLLPQGVDHTAKPEVWSYTAGDVLHQKSKVCPMD